MKRCPRCGQLDPYVKSEREELAQNVFVWTGMAAFLGVMTLNAAEWTIGWWTERWMLVAFEVVLFVVAVYSWVRLLRERSRGRRDA